MMESPSSGHASLREDEAQSASASCGHAAALALGSNVPKATVPNQNVVRRAAIKTRLQMIYSITSSASARSFAGMSRPSVLAVLRLMINSNFDGCATGKSDGFSPLRMRAM